MDDFFEDKNKTDETPKVKVGDKEYTQEELSGLVGLGETAKEYETKWNRKISEFYPDYTQKSQRLSELEKKDAERARVADEQLKREQEEKDKELAERQEAGKLTPEEQRAFAIKQAKDLGLVTREEFEAEVDKRVARYRTGEKLIDDTRIAIDEFKEKYNVNSTVDDVLKYMDDNGFRKPEKALKDMFEPQVDKWKEEQIKKLRPEGFFSQDTGTAGAKEPPKREPITKDKLKEAIRNSLFRSRGV